MTRSSRWSVIGLSVSLLGCGRTAALYLDDGDPSEGSFTGPDAPDTLPPDSLCGNGIVEDSELCDGLELDGRTCSTQGFAGGQLTCASNCTFDLSRCTRSVCGNGIIEEGETCDGGELGGETCASLDFGDEGQLFCFADCLGYDIRGCGDDCQDSSLGDAVGPGVASGNTQADDDDLPLSCIVGGRDHVMGFRATIPGSYTFDTIGSNYDTGLSIFASCHPDSELACNDDAFDLQSQLTRLLDADQRVFVVVDGYSGATGPWVLNITPPVVPDLPSCAEEDLLWTVGDAVASGSTAGEDEDLPQSCAAGGAVDRVIRFIAPTTGTFTFDTFGSIYDTALSLHRDCSPNTELVCNDDSDQTVESELSFDLTVGEQILIAVSGFGGDVGSWVLNITPP